MKTLVIVATLALALPAFGNGSGTSCGESSERADNNAKLREQASYNTGTAVQPPKTVKPAGKSKAVND